MGNESGASVRFELNGVELFMSPLTDSNIQELNNHIKQQIFEDARLACEGVTNTAFIDSVNKVAMDKVLVLDWMKDPSLLETVDRLIYLLWMGCRNEQRALSFPSFKEEIFKDFDKNISIAMEQLTIVNPFLGGRIKKGRKRK